MSKIITGPFNRVEGDLEVSLDIENSKVISSEVNSPLFRGFEFMAKGRAPLDILVFAPRICGICSVSQSVAAAGALAQVYGVKPTPNGQKSTNIMLFLQHGQKLIQKKMSSLENIQYQLLLLTKCWHFMKMSQVLIWKLLQ
jgi:Ni,Fe-hydrogenase I large subunit